MTMTREVVKDLLPGYLAGEASADTRALVEEFLQTDAELAGAVDLVRRDGPRLPQMPPPAATAEKAALERTRRLLRHRSSVLAVAVFFTLLPFTFVWQDSHVTFLLIRDQPIIGSAWLLTGAVMWGWYGMLRRRMDVSGL